MKRGSIYLGSYTAARITEIRIILRVDLDIHCLRVWLREQPTLKSGINWDVARDGVGQYTVRFACHDLEQGERTFERAFEQVEGEVLEAEEMMKRLKMRYKEAV